MNDLLIERIIPDQDFYERIVEPIEHFFVYSTLPEVIGKWLTTRPVASKEGIVCLPKPLEEELIEEDMEADWCYCGTPSYGNMIMYDNAMCTIKWFYLDCLRICQAPCGKRLQEKQCEGNYEDIYNGSLI